jgi:tyrosyl-tRNA synthetase
MNALDVLRARGFVQQETGEAELRAILDAGPVVFYIGFDPTADSLHAGHLLQVQLMAWLQRLGHHAIAVVGGGTAQIPDPTGKTELRAFLDQEQLDRNVAGIRRQIERFLDLDGVRGRLVDNAEWLMPLQYIPFLRDIGRHFSVNRMLTSEAYKIRMERGLSFIEFNYQILQAYDFLELYRRYGCVLQAGGDDQWGNILAGVDLIRRCEGAHAHAFTTPLITTSTGAKMGKTAGGAVWLDAARTSPFDWFQYWLNVDDRDVGRFLRLYTFLPLEECARLEGLPGAEIREAKRALARELTVRVHGEAAADEAERAAAAMVAGAASADLPTWRVDPSSDSARLVVVLADAGLAKSRSEARRLVEGGGVTVDGAKIVDVDMNLGPAIATGPVVVRVGRKRAVQVTAV